jgi:uncharacterized protein (TIGR03663 family)
MSRTLTLGLLLAVIAALALRCPQLAVRPMHNDEAVNAIKLRDLWERGSYQYDPSEYHGPTLLYAALGWMKLTGPAEFVNFDESQLRLVTVIFGAGLILLLPLVADGLGRRAAICAGILTAISPAMVFYSRYFIHEMLLVFFTFLAIAAGWRYTRNHKLVWALIAGAAVGLMQATKETFVLALAAMMAALILNAVWSRLRAPVVTPFPFIFRHLLFALFAWCAVALTLFTSFFTNRNGPLDAVRTYLPWLHRAGGASPHIHSWNFYLERLLWFHSGKGPVWSEGLILGLALIGIIVAFVRRETAEGNAGFVRFLAFYTIILTVIYSVISYKTPWCLLNFWQVAILLAGFGAVALLDWLERPAVKFAVGALLLLGAGQLAFQAWQAGVQFASDSRNPYVYAQTSPDILNLVARLDALAQVEPLKYQMVVKIMAPGGDYWPLPWYLRRFKHVGYWSEIPPAPYAPAMVVSTKFDANLDAKKTHLMAGLFEMRPQIFFELYAETNLWRAHLDAAKIRN